MAALLVLLAWIAPPAAAGGTALLGGPQSPPPADPYPWREAGLGERQAIGHLLDRLTFGPRLGDVERILRQGIPAWIEGQLLGDLPGADFEARTRHLSAFELSPEQLVSSFSLRGQFFAEARRQGVYDERDLSGANGVNRQLDAEAAIEAFAMQSGHGGPFEQRDQLIEHKIHRVVSSDSQLFEVMVEFWYNHFNVSLRDPRTAIHGLSYERDAIRPHALGSFRELLGATARHPAMLNYLDNGVSRAPFDAATTFDRNFEEAGISPVANPRFTALARLISWTELSRRRLLEPTEADPTPPGLNENYARELLELHTLGVDGGYDQRDVNEVARAFSGWTVLPPRQKRSLWIRHLDEPLAQRMGFRRDQEFLFRPDWHVAGPKSPLGIELTEVGLAEGEQVLDLLAGHPSTARHIATKLARRFVSASPSSALVSELATAFELHGGNIRELIRTLLRSTEFWRSARQPGRIRTPLELVGAACRSLDVDIEDTDSLNQWIEEMGQPLYRWDPPTGYPDRDESWTSVQQLLKRRNFAIALAENKIRGALVDLSRLGQSISGEDNTLPQLVRRLVRRLMPAPNPTELEALVQEVGRRRGEGTDQRYLVNVIEALSIVLGSPTYQRR